METYTPLVVILLILSVIIAVILIIVLTTSQNPNPTYTSSYTVDTSVGNQLIYIFDSNSSIALQDSTGAVTKLNDISFSSLPENGYPTLFTQYGLNGVNTSLSTPYYLGGVKKYLNYLISIYNQENGEKVALSILPLVGAEVYNLVVLSDTTLVAKIIPSIESNIAERNNSFYTFYNSTSGNTDGIYVIFSKYGVETYYYQNTSSDDFPVYTVEMISLNPLSSGVDGESNFIFENSRGNNFVGRSFARLIEKIQILIPKDILQSIVLILTSGSDESIIIPSQGVLTSESVTPPTSVSKVVTLSSGFSTVAILPHTIGSVTMGSDTLHFSDFLITNLSLLSEAVPYNNYIEISEDYNIPLPSDGSILSLWVSPENAERYIISLVTGGVRYVIAVPDTTGTVTFENLNYLGSYGTNKLPSFFTSGSVLEYYFTIIDSTNSVVGSGIPVTLSLDVNDLKLVVDSDSSVIFDVPDITVTSTSTSEFILKGSGTFVYDSITYSYDRVTLTFFGELRFTGSDGNKYRIYQR